MNSEALRIVVHGANHIVTQLGEQDLTYKDIALDVSSVLVTKDAQTMSLEDLETGDHVTVRYDANAQTFPKAISIEIS